MLEDRDEWENLLDDIWDDDNWKQFATTMYHSNKSDRIMQPSMSLVKETYVSSLFKKDSLIQLQLGSRPELLETMIWEIEEGKDEMKYWPELIEENTVLSKDDI